MPQKVRAYIYALLTPIAAILVFYGLLSNDEVQLWLVLLGTALLTAEGGLAAVHTDPTKK